MTRFLAIFLLFPFATWATDLTVSWDPVTTQIDQATSAVEPLPPGTLNYQVWQGSSKLGTTGGTTKTFTNMTPGQYCVQVTSTFVPATPTADTYGPSARTTEACVTIAPVGGPKVVSTPANVKVIVK